MFKQFHLIILLQRTIGLILFLSFYFGSSAAEIYEDCVNFKHGNLFYEVIEGSESQVKVIPPLAESNEGNFVPYHFDDGYVEIPSTVDYGGKNYSVSRIEDKAFFGSNILSVSIPLSVREIGYASFYRTQLNEFNGGFGVEIIGDAAFGASKLSEFVYPESVKYIGEQIFYGYAPDKVTIPENFKPTHIGTYFLGNCKGNKKTDVFIYAKEVVDCKDLSSIINKGGEGFYINSIRTLYVPYALVDIYREHPVWSWLSSRTYHLNFNWDSPYMFKYDGLYYQTNGKGTVRLCAPETNLIGDPVDSSYMHLAQISVPLHVKLNGSIYSVTSVGGFQGADLEEIKLSETVSKFDLSAFSGSNLKKISGYGNVTRFSNSCLKQTGINSFRVPEGTEVIDGAAFCICYNLRVLDLPSTLKQLGCQFTMSGCLAMDTLICRAVEPPLADESDFGVERVGFTGEFDYTNLISPTLFVPKGSIDLYRNAAGWKLLTDIREIDDTGIVDNDLDNSSPIIIGEPGSIRILGAQGADVTIYTVAGIEVSRFKAAGADINVPVERGIYLVSLGKTNYKIAVK